ncbi:LPS export ABC transporter periplasmic protein LptC [Pelagibacteraceae bacterium]|nr:LPS export ABC transporter periplasmic protein LptC [Pelagibacteraceae bacterium]
MERKKKLKLIQINLFIIGVLVIFFTYKNNLNLSKEKILTKETQIKVKNELNKSNQSDVFFNIEYAGLDLSGNRYVLKSKEATNNKSNQDLVNMKKVEAIFYFKDNTTLKINSDYGEYNNKTLDMIFRDNIIADYKESILTAEKAEYSNSKAFLTIQENVILNDKRGTINADKFLLDIKKQTMKIDAFNNNKINANINIE